MPTAPPDPLFPRRRAIGEQIRVAREAAELSQEEVANRIGIDRPSIVLIEAGTRNATINTLLRISDVVGVPLAQLVR
ncbi:helix-turn-helix domain-containing protein [Streptomyces hyaluromycini]|uniref:helix-turn-helix domain-containing protein n=1 Tax=Streptomyces hyaluromycini TaxID=1377993 RepID=UPI001C3F5C66|nr:helix-turn-helix transcriptional regulator [Streptomyces hyaluromycini]